MPRFRKKPVEIEAVQLPAEPTDDEVVAVQAFLAAADWENSYDGAILIHTLEGAMEARPGDWIIKGIAGEFYPCKPEIFAASYDRIDA